MRPLIAAQGANTRPHLGRGAWTVYCHVLSMRYKSSAHTAQQIPLVVSIYGGRMRSIIELRASCNRINPRGF